MDAAQLEEVANYVDADQDSIEISMLILLAHYLEEFPDRRDSLLDESSPYELLVDVLAFNHGPEIEDWPDRYIDYLAVRVGGAEELERRLKALA